jgi:hypothetical protein
VGIRKFEGLLLLFACYQPIRLAWHIFIKTATAKEMSSMLITSNISVKHMASNVIYRCLEEGTSFHIICSCGHMRVICKSIVGFSVQLHLSPGSLDVPSRQFYGGLGSQQIKQVENILYNISFEVFMAVIVHAVSFRL